MSSNSNPPDPLFIGGTGRSGTHAAARILGKHSYYRSIPVEIRFHADPRGLPWLLAGRITLKKFLKLLRGHWWYRPLDDGTTRGLHRRVSEEIFEPAVERFESEFAANPYGASATLMRALLDPFAEEESRTAWVENTNRNVAAGPTLLRLFPETRFIHMLRDGRDSASSLVKQHWGPDSIAETIDWWEERITATEIGAREIPPDRLLLMNFEDLVVRDREASYNRLLEFVNLQDEDVVRDYFTRKVNADKANIGRWREGLSSREQRKINKKYKKALEKLIAGDTPGRPEFERALAEADSG
jgi:sulfotransferase family protein